MAFDAQEVIAEARKLAARHEQLNGRISQAIGPVANYHEMTSPELAAYALKKMGVEVPEDTDHPAVTKLEGFLHGRSGSGMGAGMDADDNAVSRYINKILRS